MASCSKCHSGAVYQQQTTSGLIIVCPQCDTITPWIFNYRQQNEKQIDQDKRTLEQLQADIARRKR